MDYDWSESKVRPMDPPANPQPIAALQTLASPQGASSSTEVRPVKAPPPPPPPAPFKALPMPKPPSRQPWAPPVLQGDPHQPVLFTNGVSCVLSSQAAMPSATVPVWPERNCPATHAAIARVPQPWVEDHGMPVNEPVDTMVVMLSSQRAAVDEC